MNSFCTDRGLHGQVVCMTLLPSCEGLNAASFTGVLTVEKKEWAMNAVRMHHGFYKFLPTLVQFRAGGEQIKLHTQVKLRHIYIEDFHAFSLVSPVNVTTMPYLNLQSFAYVVCKTRLFDDCCLFYTGLDMDGVLGLLMAHPKQAAETLMLTDVPSIKVQVLPAWPVWWRHQCLLPRSGCL